MEGEPQELWKEIIQLTSDSDDVVAKSLRIAAFIWLQEFPAVDVKRQLISLLNAGSVYLRRRRGRLPDLERGGVLFCFPHQTQSNLGNLIPVAREARRRGLLTRIVTVGPASAVELREFVGEVPVVSTRDLLSQQSVRSRGQSALATVRKYRQLSDLLERHAPSLAVGWRRNFGVFLREISTSVQMAKAFEVLLQAWKPACVVSTSDLWPLEYQFHYQASRLRIPSLVVQHGVVGFFWWPFLADVYSMWGETFRQKMLDLGAPSNRLVVCGMPAADELFRKRASGSAAGTITRKPAVCLILSHAHTRRMDPGMFRKYGEVLSEAIRSTPFIRWCVKLHPAEDHSFYQTLGEDVYQRLQIHPRTVSLEEAVNDADVTATLFSTAGLEAMILQRPLIVLSVSDKVREVAWWPALGGGVYAATADALKNQLLELTSNSQYRSTLLERQRHFLTGNFENRGHAAEAVVDLLEQYLSDRTEGVSCQRRSR